MNFGPAERARMVKESIDISDKMQAVGSGYIPKIDQTTCSANSKGLFAYYQDAEAGFILTCRMADGSGLRLGRHHRREGHQHDRRRAR